MLSKEDTRLLAETGSGTPMGELFRRFWLPVLLSEEVPAPDCPPVAIRILGEDLVAFRDTGGRVGLMSAYCAHRHAHLFWGRNEGNGLRCTYHGWKYDANGSCVDMPNEPPSSTYKNKIRIKAYPTQEAGRCVWAYLGPSDLTPPDLPHLEWARLPESHVAVTKRLQESNWAQATEGGIDSSHISYLHNMDLAAATATTTDGSPMISVVERDFGLVEAARRIMPDGRHYWRVRPFMPPSFMVIPAGSQEGRNLSGHVWVPIDDGHVWAFTMTWNPGRPLNHEDLEKLFDWTGVHAEVDKDVTRWDLNTSNAWQPVRNRSNNYFIDRQVQQASTFTGIRGISEQDCSIQESMGAIVPRWEEHLAAADRGIVQFRRTVLRLAKNLQNGEEPDLPRCPEKYAVRSAAFVIDQNEDWEDEAKRHMSTTV